MPSVSNKQRAYMGAALGRARSGHPAASDPQMSQSQLSDFAKKPKHKKGRSNPMRHIGEMCHMNDHK